MDPLTVSAIAAGSQALGGIVQAVVGGGQQRQAKRMMKSNPRPQYKISQAVKDNQNLIESRASQGLSDQAKQVYAQGAERGLSASLGTLVNAGGSVNNVADLYGEYADGMSKLSLIDEEMRAKNIAAMIEQNDKMAAELDKEWQVNTWAPYADKAQAAATLQKQGSENVWKGVNTVIGAGANFATSAMYGKEGAEVYGQRKTKPTAAQSVQSRFPGLTGGGRAPLDLSDQDSFGEPFDMEALYRARGYRGNGMIF